MKQFDVITQFIKCKCYQSDAKKLNQLIHVFHCYEFDIIWRFILDKKFNSFYLSEVNVYNNIVWHRYNTVSGFFYKIPTLLATNQRENGNSLFYCFRSELAIRINLICGYAFRVRAV